MAKVLLIEDEENIRKIISYAVSYTHLWTLPDILLMRWGSN